MHLLLDYPADAYAIPMKRKSHPRSGQPCVTRGRGDALTRERVWVLLRPERLGNGRRSQCRATIIKLTGTNTAADM